MSWPHSTIVRLHLGIYETGEEAKNVF
jgi:hypothetical protein